MGLAGLVGAGLALPALSGCAAGAEANLVRAELARRPPGTGADAAAAAAISRAAGGFAVDLLRLRLRTNPGNVAFSPYSILTALAMVRNGARGETAREMDEALRFPDLARLNAGLNATDQALSGRTTTIELANAVWGQRGVAWSPDLLRVLAAEYDTGVREQDFGAAPAPARETINRWVAGTTSDRIRNLMPEGSITTDTRMVLVNALYLTGQWRPNFTSLAPQPFRGGSGRAVPMMAATLPRGGLVGDGWQAVRIPVRDDELALTVVLPDRDLDDLSTRLARSGLTTLLGPEPTRSARLTMPPFSFRSPFAMRSALEDLGMRLAFGLDADFSGLTTSERLKIDAVQHQAWIKVDERGLEAAAATGVSVGAVSAPPPPELELVLDRPFLFCVHDLALELPLLVGVVQDPAAD